MIRSMPALEQIYAVNIRSILFGVPMEPFFPKVHCVSLCKTFVRAYALLYLHDEPQVLRFALLTQRIAVSYD